jgi:uncharacterized protein YyaL (SSP411 family)
MLWRPSEQRLLRRFRDGEAAIDAYAEDYACLIWGLLELFQTTGDAAWLSWAIELQARQDALFWDEAQAGWFSTTGDDPSVLLRLKEDYDGAEPSASAVSVLNLLALSHLASMDAAKTKIERTLGRYGPRAGRAARAIPLMLAALSTFHAGVTQVVIVGARDDERTRAMQVELARHYLPFGVTIPVEPGDGQARLAAVAPAIGAMAPIGGAPAAYVCRDFACHAPVARTADLGAQLSR